MKPQFPSTIYVTKERPAVREPGDEEYLSATGRLEYVDDPVTAVYDLRSVGKMTVTETHRLKTTRAKRSQS